MTRWIIGFLVLSYFLPLLTPDLAFSETIIPASGVTLHVDQLPPVYPGQPVTLDAGGIGGTGLYQYKFFLKGPGDTVATEIQKYSTNNHLDWTPTSKNIGSNSLGVQIRSIGSTAAVEAQKWLSLSISVPPSATGATLSHTLSTVFYPGIPINLSAAGIGGSGIYEYKFFHKAPGAISAKEVRKYSPEGTYFWTPTATQLGLNSLGVQLRSIGSTSGFEAQKWLSVLITQPPPCISATLLPSSHSPQFTGRHISFSADGTGGSDAYEYQFFIKSPHDSTAARVRNYSPNAIFDWMPDSTNIGTNTIGVHVRSLGSSAPYEAQKWLTFAIEANPDDFSSRLLPAPLHGGFEMDGYWVWCMSVIKGDDGLYHGFASRWPTSLPFGNWVTNSEIVHVMAINPEGPYTFQDVVFSRRGSAFWDGQMTHNPAIRKVGDQYLLFYTGTTYGFGLPDGPIDDQMRLEARSNQRIGVASATSPWGPWTRSDAPALEVRPGEWDSFMTTNAAPWVNDDGSILMVYKSTASDTDLLRLGIARAESFSEPFQRLIGEPILNFGNEGNLSDPTSRHVEDPFLWWNGSEYRMLLKDINGTICGERGGGVQVRSSDGITWETTTPCKAYSRTVLWEDGYSNTMAAFERPQLLFENGLPTHLFAATGSGPDGKFMRMDHTWNMCIPLLAH